MLIERAPDSTVDENNQHYESLAENLKKELRQIAQNFDEDRKPPDQTLARVEEDSNPPPWRFVRVDVNQ